MKIANKAVSIHRGDGNNGELAGRFNEVFVATMEKLAAPLLRQSSNGASPPSSEAQSDLNRPHGNANSPDDSVTQAVIACWNG